MEHFIGLIESGEFVGFLNRAQRAELTWPFPSKLDDAQLENQLFPLRQPITPENRGMPPLDYLYQEFKRKGVTLQLLWCEYKQSNPGGYQYSQFCKRYQKWVDKLDVCLRQEYRAGEKLFVDYAGQTIPVQNPLTPAVKGHGLCPWMNAPAFGRDVAPLGREVGCHGLCPWGSTRQIQEASLFVAALGASHYTFAEATFSQDLPSWISDLRSKRMWYSAAVVIP